MRFENVNKFWRFRMEDSWNLGDRNLDG